MSEPVVWNRTDPINEAAAEAILAGLPAGLPDDAPVLLIVDDSDEGRVVSQVQPNDPRQPGWVWWSDAAAALAYGRDVVEGKLSNGAGDPVPLPTEPGPAPRPVTREEFDQLRADLDWTINFAVTGEA